jgi:hypothetical protein
MHHLPSVNCDRIVTIIEEYVVSNRLVSRLGIGYYLIHPGICRVRGRRPYTVPTIVSILLYGEKASCTIQNRPTGSD